MSDVGERVPVRRDRWLWPRSLVLWLVTGLGRGPYVLARLLVVVVGVTYLVGLTEFNETAFVLLMCIAVIAGEPR